MIEIETIVEELDEAGCYECTELGEYWRGLCGMWRIVEYGGGADFMDSLQKEIVIQYEWFKNNFTWIEHEAIDCDKCGQGRPAYRELVYNEDFKRGS